jgi:hypothetical protein
MKEAILAVLMAMSQHFTDKGVAAETRYAELVKVATAIDTAAAGDRKLAAAMISLGRHESGFAMYVLQNRCSEGPVGARCDPDKKGNPRAIGPWQLWAVACADRSSVDSQAMCVARRLRGEMQRCRKRHPAGDWAGAFAGYRSIVCEWPAAVERVATMQSVLRQMP